MGNDPSAALTALAAVGLLVLIMRWVFSSGRRGRTRPIDAATSGELGLLTVVIAGVPRADAMGRRAVLGEHGIRSSMSLRRDGLFDVLVFSGDVDQARAALSE